MTLRYSGPRGKGFSGDTAKAASLQRTADLLVGSVVDRLKAPPFNGKGMLVDRRRLADGSWIHVLVNMIGNQPIVRTWIESPVPPVEPEPIEVSPFNLLSGLFDARNPTWEIDGYIRQIQRLEKTTSGAWKRSNWENSETLVNSLTSYYPGGCSLALDFRTVPSAYSGRYSGEMKKVVQLLYGMVDQDDKTWPVLYSPCFSLTHGIFTSSNGVRWVIEISESDGVTAWPLPLLERAEAQRLGASLPYFPAPVETLPEIGARLLLATAEQLSPFYNGKQSFFEMCGWAFSADGHEAINTAWDGGGDDYTKSYAATITISENDDSPAAASLSVPGGKYLFSHYDTLSHPKFPTSYGLQGASVRSRYLSQTWVPLPPPPLEQAPIYAYFNENKKVVIYYSHYYNHFPYAQGYFLASGASVPVPYGVGEFSRTPFNVMIVPFNEREGFYLYSAVAGDPNSVDSKERLIYIQGNNLINIFSRDVRDPQEITLGPFAFFNAPPWQTPAINQWMDASLDAFTGSGTLSKVMDGYHGDARHVIGDADLYRLNEIRSSSYGWFGAPFYDKMEGS